jgi:hypothetical protein
MLMRVFALLLLRSVILCAQEYNFRNFGVSEGLGNLAVRQIYQDRVGFIWVSTENVGQAFIAMELLVGTKGPTRPALPHGIPDCPETGTESGTRMSGSSQSSGQFHERTIESMT